MKIRIAHSCNVRLDQSVLTVSALDGARPSVVLPVHEDGCWIDSDFLMQALRWLAYEVDGLGSAA
jgi:hypothetical protein